MTLAGPHLSDGCGKRTNDPDVGAASIRGRMGVVVVNYRSCKLIETNLAPLTLPSTDFCVVIVDNFACAGEAEAIRSIAGRHGWEFIGLTDNKGFGAAVNAGIEHASRLGCDCFLLLNPDAAISAAAAYQLRAHSLADPTALITPRIVSSLGEIRFAGSRIDRRGNLHDVRSPGSQRRFGAQSARCTDLAGAEWLPATCLAVHRDQLRRSGGFDKRYFMYWEDVDFSVRCALDGASLLIRHDLTVIHDPGGTQGAQRGKAKSSLYYRYNCRNRLVFSARNLTRREILVWMWWTPSASWKILLRGGRRQLLKSPRPLLAMLRGSLAGLAIALLTVIRPAARHRLEAAPQVVGNSAAVLRNHERS